MRIVICCDTETEKVTVNSIFENDVENQLNEKDADDKIESEEDHVWDPCEYCGIKRKGCNRKCHMYDLFH